MNIRLNKRILKTLFVCYLLSAVTYFLTGCATVPTRESIAGYKINGIDYFPLITLCGLKGISWEYDTYTRSIILTKGLHKINLRVGDTQVLVDGNPVHLKNPVDIYQGVVVVPGRFREQILDSLSASLISRIKKIVVDAGHGGHDPGALGRSGLREKDVNLDIAKRVDNLLKSKGIEVIMTRSTDKFIPLHTRVEIANNSNADLFVSIHSNANRLRSLNGFEVYYVAPNVSDSKRAYTAARDERLSLKNAFFASPALDLKAIVWDMIYTYSRAESIELSRSICRMMDRNMDLQILGVKAARFEVLRGAQMPAVLIEVGFLSNLNEERKLKNAYYRQKIAEAIMQGIQDYSNDLVLAEER